MRVVCVTGATGFVGAHVVRACLAAGHEIHAVVRPPHTDARVGFLRAFEGAKEQLRIFEGDVMRPESLDLAMRGADAVVHAAASVRLGARDPQREIVDIAVIGTRNVLGAAARAGSVRRFVLTSSDSAIQRFDKPVDYVFTEADWCDDATLDNNPYGIAKATSEKEMWAFVRERPEMEGVSINPSMVLGPVYSRGHLKTSISVVKDVLGRTYPGYPRMWHNLVDADAVAEAHAVALTSDNAVNNRYLLSNGGMYWRNLAELLSKRYVVRTNELPNWLIRASTWVDPRASWSALQPLLGRPFPMDGSKVTRDLGIRYRDPEHAVFEAAESLEAKGFVKVRRR